MAGKKVGSPLASGGAGTIFEYRVAAILLADLLSGAQPPGLGTSIDRLGLQQLVRGHHLDDVSLYGPGQTSSVEFQVKRTLTVTANDADFADAATQALHALVSKHDSIRRGEHVLGVIAQGNAKALSELDDLTRWARPHADPDTFYEIMVKDVVAEPLRNRLNHVKAVVQKAIAAGAPPQGDVNRTTHRLLAALHVWRPAVDDNGTDYRVALDRLRATADRFGQIPSTIFAHLASLAQTWGPYAGVVDADTVLRNLRRRGLRDVTLLPNVKQDGIDVDAVVRGPIDALELTEALSHAEQLLACGDTMAAAAFEALATKLHDSKFGPHAIVMRRRQADALQAAGDLDQATMIRAGLAWHHLDQVQPWEAGFATHDESRVLTDGEVSPEASRALEVVNAAIWVAKGSSIDGFLQAFDQMAPGDPFEAQAAVFLCEHAIAADHMQVVTSRIATLRAILEGNPSASTTESGTRLLHARLRMGIADATGEWQDAIRAMHRSQPPNIVAWAHARHGRYLALTGDGAGAQHEYHEAIDRAVASQMYDEAADWLYALRTVRHWYTDSIEADDQHPRAQALRPLAKASVLPGAPHTKELALESMLDPTAQNESLRRTQSWRWQSAVRAELTDELSARRATAEVLRRAGDIEQAVEQLVSAGSVALAKKVAAELPENTANMPCTTRPAPHARAAAFSAAASAADLLSDDQARAWATLGLEEIAQHSGPEPRSEPDPYRSAYEVVAATPHLLNDAQQHQLLTVIGRLIEDSQAGYVPQGDSITSVLSALSNHPEAPAIYAQGLSAHHMLAQQLLAAVDSFTHAAPAIAASLSAHAESHRWPALAILRLGLDVGPGSAVARQEVESWLQPRPQHAGRRTRYQDETYVADFAAALDNDLRHKVAHTALRRGLDQGDIRSNRRGSLAILNYLAQHLEPAARITLMPDVLDVARGGHEDSADFGWVAELPISSVALLCVTQLDPDPQTWVEIQQIGITQLGSSDDQRPIIQALLRVPESLWSSDYRLLAHHTLPSLRALAGIRWVTHRSHEPLPPHIASLARDPKPVVRRSLAHALGKKRESLTPALRNLVEVLAQDVRRSVRQPVKSMGPDARPSSNDR
ncbi:hypothetical protein AB0B66_09815 [Catellatospora sp. NPDC049111]|uniref:hypothetical protein n=1 Tax=Catellatospora sp. NPDC049111 TaxID=3155271 RepID=UPI0034060FE7